MATNPFENSRISDGTLQRGAQHAGGTMDETSPALEISDMIEEGGPAPSRVGNSPAIPRPGILGVRAASMLLGGRVRSPAGEELGNIKELMLDVESGCIAYAVLSLTRHAGIPVKHVSVPWSALKANKQVDQGEHEFMLEMDRHTLESALNTDKDNCLDLANQQFGREVH